MARTKKIIVEEKVVETKKVEVSTPAPISKPQFDPSIPENKQRHLR